VSRERIAYHEAVHAVAAYAYDVPIEEVSLEEGRAEESGALPYSGSVLMGHLILTEYSRLSIDLSGEALEALQVAAMHQVEIHLAGMVAAQLYQDDPNDGGPLQDIAQVFDLLGVLLGVPASEVPADEEDPLLRTLVESTQYLIKSHWQAVKALAETLLERTTLTGNEARQIIDGALKEK
jgi:hypothetical protein